MTIAAYGLEGLTDQVRDVGLGEGGHDVDRNFGLSAIGYRPSLQAFAEPHRIIIHTACGEES